MFQCSFIILYYLKNKIFYQCYVLRKKDFSFRCIRKKAFTIFQLVSDFCSLKSVQSFDPLLFDAQIDDITKIMPVKTRIIHVFFLFALFATALGYCEGHFNGNYAHCSYDYGYTDQNCTQFRFDNCFWVQCASWVDCGNTTCCDTYTTVNNSNWDFCMNYCCGKSYTFAQSSLQQCQNDLNASSTLFIIIFGSVFGFIIVFMVALYIKQKSKEGKCLCCRQIAKCLSTGCGSFCNLLTCACLRNSQNQQDPSCYHAQQDEIFKLWEKDTSYNQKVNEICTICFQPAPSLLLQSCDHVFHRECIITSIQKKKECPICGSSVGDIVKAYCEGCFKESYTTSLKYDLLMLRLRKQLCQKCWNKSKQ